jgi:hypothetical protein
LFLRRRYAVEDSGLEVNDGEASLAEAIAVLGIVASGFFAARRLLLTALFTV